MTTTAWILAALTAVFAVADWVGVVTERQVVRYVAKPGTLAALIGVAVTLEPFHSTVRAWMAAGLVCSLAGDVFLMLSERWFVAGLTAFLVGHLAYVVGMASAPTATVGLLVGVAVVAVAAGTLGRLIVTTVRRGPHGRLAGPVTAYVAVISAMVVAAFGTWAPAAIVGALLFYASDATLAWNRFVRPVRHGGLAVMVTYHLAQAGLVAWLVSG
jgi:uncharacterized membrane protein YhhN